MRPAIGTARSMWALLVLLVAACGARAPNQSSLEPAGACLVATGPQPASLTFGVTEPIDLHHFAQPRNPAEATVFRQLYETLVRVDCAGDLRPGLAASWSSSDNGRVWQFRLRSGAAFWDGTPVTASAIAAAWSSNARAATIFSAVTAANAATLRVELQQAAATPELFAHPQLELVRVASVGGWPIGSGAFRPIEATPNLVRLAAIAGQSTLEFRVFGDARRALDANVDALVSGDAAVLDYARALPGYTLSPLPWSRTYALATRTESDTTAPPADALAGLARDAVRADARPAEPPFWWRAAECVPPVGMPAPGNSQRTRTVAYPRGDAFARALAERIVALAWPASRAPAWLSSALPLGATGAPPTAAGLDQAALLNAARTGNPLALVLPLPRAAGRACPAHFTTDSLALFVAGTGYRITPLLDARSYFVHRSTVGTVLIDGDGTLRIAPRQP